jgi:hypothetical protein
MVNKYGLSRELQILTTEYENIIYYFDFIQINVRH